MKIRIAKNAGGLLRIPAEIKDSVGHWITEWKQSLTPINNSRPTDSKRFVSDVKQPFVPNLVIRILHAAGVQIGPSPKAGAFCCDRVIDHASHVVGARAIQARYQH